MPIYIKVKKKFKKINIKKNFFYYLIHFIFQFINEKYYFFSTIQHTIFFDLSLLILD
jgi:hypothetical protein